jgi:hypothetical protein
MDKWYISSEDLDWKEGTPRAKREISEKPNQELAKVRKKAGK